MALLQLNSHNCINNLPRIMLFLEQRTAKQWILHTYKTNGVSLQFLSFVFREFIDHLKRQEPQYPTLLPLG